MDRVDSELGAVDSDPGAPPTGSAGSAAVATPGGGEQPLEPGRLEPSRPDDPPRTDDLGAAEENGQLGEVGDPELSDAGTSGTGPVVFPVPAEPDAAPPPPPPPEPSCTTRSFGGSCYEVFAALVSWNEAEARCVTWGGHLAKVESAQEDDFLDAWPADVGLPPADGSGVWLGATDAAFDGDFRWWDGSGLTFIGWATAQPDNGPGGADCIEKRNDGAGFWYDWRCMDPKRYICERPL